MITSGGRGKPIIRRRCRAPRRRAAAIVEMAVVTPLLLTMMFGMIEFGWVFMVQNTLTNAAREACRTAILPGSTEDDIRGRFAEIVQPIGITPAPDMLTIVPETPANPVATVRVQVPYSQVSLLGSFLCLDPNKMLGSSCSMRN